LRILADENMPLVEELFSDFGDVERFAGRTLQPSLAQQADILLVRSITRVDERLLGRHKPKFVGTATIGTDHLDTHFLSSNNIPYTNAPGCNARSVAEYVIATIYAQRLEVNGLSATVIAQGNVGKKVATLLRSMGAKVAVYDPHVKDLLGQIDHLDHIANSDLLCVHAPMVRDGAHPTDAMIQYSHLSLLADNALVISAGRGGVICEQAIKQLTVERTDIRWALDVWANEPVIDPQLVSVVDQATPHVAGYSVEGKRMGSYMLYQNCCELFGKPERSFSEFQKLQTIQWPGSIYGLLGKIYDPKVDDQRLRDALLSDSSGGAFDQLRKSYPARHEYASYQVLGAPQDALEELNKLGFSVDV